MDEISHPLSDAMKDTGNLNKDPDTEPWGVSFYHSKVKHMTQLRFIWKIHVNLDQNDMSALSFDVVTRLNPADHQEYTSCGLHILNSGANLKWEAADSVQSNISTPSWYVMAWDSECVKSVP